MAGADAAPASVVLTAEVRAVDLAVAALLVEGCLECAQP